MKYNISETEHPNALLYFVLFRKLLKCNKRVKSQKENGLAPSPPTTVFGSSRQLKSNTGAAGISMARAGMPLEGTQSLGSCRPVSDYHYQGQALLSKGKKEVIWKCR